MPNKMIMRYLWTMGKGHFTLFSGGSLARWPLQNTTTEVTKLIPWEILAFFLCQRVSLGETILGQPKRSYLKESDRCCHLSLFLPLIASQRKLDEKTDLKNFTEFLQIDLKSSLNLISFRVSTFSTAFAHVLN